MNGKIWTVALLFIALLWSCEKDTENISDVNSEYKSKTLVSATLVASYPKQQVELLLKAAETQLGGNLTLSNRNADGIKVYYVEYKSTYVNNEPVTLSGLVTVPDNPTRENKIISFQNGTISVHSGAPSKQLTHPEFLILQSLAGLGFAVVIPDYMGFGASEQLQHPYHHKELFQRTISDLLIATLDMEKTGDYKFKLNGELFLTGYSLGGWASLVTHHYLEQNPIDGLELLGSACGAGAYNLVDMRDYLVEQTNYIQPFYVPNMLISYMSAGDLSGDLSLYINEHYATKIPDLIDGKHSSSQVNAELTKNMQDLFTESFINDFYSDTKPEWIEIRNVLKQNSQPAWKNKKPIALFHGDADQHVPYLVTENIINDFRSIGVNENMVQLHTLIGEDHISGVMPMYVYVINNLLE